MPDVAPVTRAFGGLELLIGSRFCSVLYPRISSSGHWRGQMKTRRTIVLCGFSNGDADRARTDDLLRDRHFRSMCAIVRGCAPGRADVAFMRGCPDSLVCHMCASVRRRGGHLVSNLVSRKTDCPAISLPEKPPPVTIAR